MKNYYEVTQILDQLFDKFNEKYYGGEITKPLIAVMHDPKKSSYGWCSTQKIWKGENGDFYEINICAESLSRPIKEICATLLHEMAHLYNLEHGIKDCSGGYYHNKKFKETAEAHGLVIEKDAKHGWSSTSLKEDTAQWIDENIEIESFGLSRVEPEVKAAVKRHKYKYYVCPCCGAKFYSIYEISAQCTDCEVDFQRYK